MVEITEQVKAELRCPLGEFVKDLKALKEIGSRRIISIGDICTLELLALGIRPHLAVFDFHSMRRGIDPGMIKALEASFPEMARYRNPAGTISDKLLADASRLIDHGGAVLIDGEEDLTALAFILKAKESDIIIYGQPNEGVVMVRPGAGIKRKIKGWLKK